MVMTHDEVAAVLSLMNGTAQLVARLLDGSGLRIKDIDIQMKQLTVRSGKGGKDRFTTFPATLTPLLQTTWPGSRHYIDRPWPRLTDLLPSRTLLASTPIRLPNGSGKHCRALLSISHP
jgi:hypothetical protein